MAKKSRKPRGKRADTRRKTRPSAKPQSRKAPTSGSHWSEGLIDSAITNTLELTVRAVVKAVTD